MSNSYFNRASGSLRRTIFIVVLTALVPLFVWSCASIPAAKAPADSAMDHPRPYDPGPQKFKRLIRQSKYLTMSDGVMIALDLYLPAGLAESEKIPAILWQTRYWRSADISNGVKGLVDKPRAIVKDFVTRGYAWIAVDVRGSGASYGSRPMPWSPNEVQDGAEIVDWIISQPWSNGRVGSTGISYAGTTAEFLTANMHPAVKAAAPRFSLFDPYLDIGFPGGVHNTWFTQHWHLLNSTLDGNELPAELQKRNDFLGRMARKGVRPVDGDTDGKLLADAIKDHVRNFNVHRSALEITYIDDETAEGVTTLDFSPFTYANDIDGSATVFYNISGWYDGGYPHAAIKRHLTLKNPENRLILGPWTHGGRYSASHFNAGKTRFHHSAELLKFFDYYLKGKETGILEEKRVHYYTLGEEQWKTADIWPPPAQPVSYYFGPDNTLIKHQPDSTDGKDIYQVDFKVGTGNKARWNSLLTGGFVEYPDRTEQDRNLQVYESAPLIQAVEVTGHPIASLWVTSTAVDGTFFIYLEDVDPTGKVNYVTEGMLRALHRKLSHGKPPYEDVVPYHSFKRDDGRPLIPGKPAQLVFDLLPVSYLFKKGHRIRVALAGADKDHFALIPDEPPTVHVHRAKERPSFIELPVIPKAD